MIFGQISRWYGLDARKLALDLIDELRVKIGKIMRIEQGKSMSTEEWAQAAIEAEEIKTQPDWIERSI